MRIVVTGAAGFIGGVVVRQLVARGEQVVALVRDPARPGSLDPPSVEVVQSDLSEVETLTRQVDGTDALIHAAGSYRVGIPAAERAAMTDANVGATRRVLDAAIAAGVPRIVHVSTINAFGNTRGMVVDETFRRDPRNGFVSHYDETKWLAQEEAEARIAAGAPIVIAMPGATYGPGDHSGIGQQLGQASSGTLPFIALGALGISPVHVDDLAAGILATLDRGALGRAYALGGPNVRLIDALRIAARAGGRRLPRLTIPTVVLRVGTAIAPNLGAALGVRPNLREILRAADGVTYWASSARAASELGYHTRGLEPGIAEVFGNSAGAAGG